MQKMILKCYVSKELALQHNKFEHGEFEFVVTEDFYNKLHSNQKEVVNALLLNRYRSPPKFQGLTERQNSFLNIYVETYADSEQAVLWGISRYAQYLRENRERNKKDEELKVELKRLTKQVPWYKRILK